MAVKLLNSAVMPKEGQYSAYKISFQEFKLLLQKAHKRGELESYIGYPQNVELIRKWTGIEVPLNRAETDLNDGDEMLVMKLKYRVSNPADKGKEVGEDDFEFFYVRYRSL
ncbi:MAG: hypothetical protein DRH57_00095 [Candidatus Cloacimonadota bacterium]|nr:MAG: hypothetical protein DRH57_00095 [Candidatus Cloacimonadota bacterium]